MATTTYPVLFKSQFLGASAAVIYTVPTSPDQTFLHDLVVKLTNVTTATATATVHATDPSATDDSQSGAHTGANNASVLTDSGQTWTVDQWVGYKVNNLTDGSSGIITANTSTTVTATLSGGAEDDWDTSDVYSIVEGPLDLNAVVKQISIPPRDFVLVPVPRLDGGAEIYGLASAASTVTIQAIGGKLRTQ